MLNTQKKDQYLIVVSILEGRNFPRRSNLQLVVEARLDGELIATDEVAHTEYPIFNTDLAWEVDAKGLRLFRMQRVPIKLQCFAVNKKNSFRELLGHVVVDLRVVHPKPQVAKWYPLLSTKYYWMKPQLRLRLTLEKDTGGVTPLQLTATSPSIIYPVKTMSARQKFPDTVDAKWLQPKLNEDGGFYTIGPPELCTATFTLSVTVVFAANISQLIPSALLLPEKHDGFYFYYTLLSNDVTTDTFPDLLSPSFPAERATVRVRSSIDILQQFFNLQPGLQVHLCVGDMSLGCAEIVLNELLKKNSTEIFVQPVAVEGTFELKPLEEADIPVPGRMTPVVGVTVTLRLEDEVQSPQIVLQQPHVLNLDGSSQSASPSKTPPRIQQPKPPTYSQSPPVRLQVSAPSASINKSDPNTKSSVQSSQAGKLTPENMEKTRPRHNSDIEEIALSDSPNSSNSSQESSRITRMQGVSNSSPAAQNSAELHHYCFTLDMRWIRLSNIDSIIYCFLRYSYPFFGSSAPILTHPVVEVQRNIQMPLPHGFCAFTFAATSQQVSHALQSLPLYVELVQRDRSRNEDVILGMAALHLGAVLNVAKSRLVTDNGKTGVRQISSSIVPFQFLDDQPCPLGDLQFVMSLDDLGPTTLPQELINQHQQKGLIQVSNQLPTLNQPSVMDSRTNYCRGGQDSQIPIQDPSGKNRNPLPSQCPEVSLSEMHRQMAVEVAVELEQWKAMQEERFRKELKQKETEYLETLVNEWKKRDTERELVLQRKLAECRELEEKLRTALADVDKRERMLAVKEMEIQQVKTEFERERNYHLREVKTGYRRMKEDLENRLEIEQLKTQEAVSQREKIEVRVKELERKLETKIEEFEAFRDEQRNNPELRLQSDFHLLTLEKAELERKLESVTKSKVHYKQQWGRSLRELAHIKQKVEADARAQLYKQQQELESMRLQYLASEGKEERTALQEIKGDLNTIKEHVAMTKRAATGSENIQPRPQRQISFLDSEFDSDTEYSMDNDNVASIKQERETLLRTGVYKESDRIIKELDRQIKEAISRNHVES